MATAALVDKVDELGDALGKILRLLPPDDPLYRADGKKDVASFLFEIRVLTELLQALARMGEVRVVRRGKYIVLARSPAHKRNKSYFELSLTNGSFHLCPGVKVRDRHGDDQAPDLSLQFPTAGDTPEAGHVLAIWDAKLRGESAEPNGDALDKSEVALFMYMMDVLKVPRPHEAPNALAGWPPAFEVSALITNGGPSSHADAALLERGISQTAAFRDAQTACQPSRSDHLAQNVIES